MDERRSLVEIDLAGVRTSEELQSLLSRSLDFPDWYGGNWNAFWDAITGLVDMPRCLRLAGWVEFSARLPEDARLLRKCLDDAEADLPALAAQVEYAWLPARGRRHSRVRRPPRKVSTTPMLLTAVEVGGVRATTSQ